MENGCTTDYSKSVLANIKSINAIFAEVGGTTSITKQQADQLTILLNKIREVNNK
jgi:hypothetical protein